MLVGCGAEEPIEVTDEGALSHVEEPGLEEAVAIDDDSSSAVSGYCDDVTTWDSSWANFEAEVLTLVNQRRAAGATCGGVAKAPAPALTLDTRLRCAARKHSKDMGVNDFFSHTGSNGSTPWQRMNDAGYTYSTAGENIAAGYSTPSAVVTGWMNSTGHCNNIMNPNFVHLGVGYYYDSSSPYYRYWTQDFGKP